MRKYLMVALLVCAGLFAPHLSDDEKQTIQDVHPMLGKLEVKEQSPMLTSHMLPVDHPMTKVLENAYGNDFRVLVNTLFKKVIDYVEDTGDNIKLDEATHTLIDLCILIKLINWNSKDHNSISLIGEITANADKLLPLLTEHYNLDQETVRTSLIKDYKVDLDLNAVSEGCDSSALIIRDLVDNGPPIDEDAKELGEQAEALHSDIKKLPESGDHNLTLEESPKNDLLNLIVKGDLANFIGDLLAIACHFIFKPAGAERGCVKSLVEIIIPLHSKSSYNFKHHTEITDEIIDTAVLLYVTHELIATNDHPDGPSNKLRKEIKAVLGKLIPLLQTRYQIGTENIRTVLIKNYGVKIDLRPFVAAHDGAQDKAHGVDGSILSDTAIAKLGGQIQDLCSKLTELKSKFPTSVATSVPSVLESVLELLPEAYAKITEPSVNEIGLTNISMGLYALKLSIEAPKISDVNDGQEHVVTMKELVPKIHSITEQLLDILKARYGIKFLHSRIGDKIAFMPVISIPSKNSAPVNAVTQEHLEEGKRVLTEALEGAYLNIDNGSRGCLRPNMPFTKEDLIQYVIKGGSGKKGETPAQIDPVGLESDIQKNPVVKPLVQVILAEASFVLSGEVTENLRNHDLFRKPRNMSEEKRTKKLDNLHYAVHKISQTLRRLNQSSLREAGIDLQRGSGGSNSVSDDRRFYQPYYQTQESVLSPTSTVSPGGAVSSVASTASPGVLAPLP